VLILPTFQNVREVLSVMHSYCSRECSFQFADLCFGIFYASLLKKHDIKQQTQTYLSFVLLIDPGLLERRDDTAKKEQNSPVLFRFETTKFFSHKSIRRY